MGPEFWTRGAVVGLALTQLLVFWYLYRTSTVSTRNNQSRDPDGGAGPSDGGRQVVCPDCGTANDPGYRFCQDCVTTLPGSPNEPGPTDSHRERGLS